jgi:prevent-host-death family protein
MRTVGVKELKEHTSEILREVRAGTVVDVTERGVAIARLIPVEEPILADEEIQLILDDLDSLAAEISAKWPKDLSVKDVMDDIRQ